MVTRRIVVAVALMAAALSTAPAHPATVFDTLGETFGGQFGSDLVVDFSFAGTLQMFTPTGGTVLNPADDTLRGLISLDLVTAGGTAAMSSAVGFFGQQWQMHDVALNACGKDFTVNAGLLFNWNRNNNIPVFAEFKLTPTLDPGAADPTGVLAFAVSMVDSDNDGIPGHRMWAGPFPGFTPSFTGIATVKTMRRGYIPNHHVTVPGSTATCTPLSSVLGGFF